MIKRGLSIVVLLILFATFTDAYNFRNQTSITTATWHVFNVIYDPDFSIAYYPAALPKNWPTNNATNSDVVVNFSSVWKLNASSQY